MKQEALLQRFEQQVTVFEKLHADELRGFAEKLAKYQQIHADEVSMLRAELERLKGDLAKHEQAISAVVTSQGQA